MKRLGLILFLSVALAFFAKPLFAATTAGEVERTGKVLEQEQKLRQKIETPKPKAQVEEPAPAKKEAPAAAGQKVKVTKINVTGVTLLPASEINKLIADNQNKELSLRDIQKIADEITDQYRQKGYITSRAYLPPQRIEAGVLEIRAIEGITGTLDIKGNRYFKTESYKKRITLKAGEPFNYNILRNNLVKINQLPDRSAKVVLTPGKAAGATDMVLEAKDRLPLHAGFTWDNFGSRYINKNRYQVVLRDSNLLGREDSLTMQYQIADKEDYTLQSVRYLYPVTDTTTIGFFEAQSKIRLGRELKDLNTRSKSRYYSLFAEQAIIDEENLSFTLNAGFDYKDIFNFQIGNETSRDRMRIFKGGFDLDASDSLLGGGRTIFTNSLDFGVPDMMGGSKAKDPRSSRAGSGSGGKFIKNEIYLVRVQKMPLSTQLLWKNQMQISPYNLTSAEQFQLGGIANVRGYPPAEKVGDQGYSMTWEWSAPPYFIPKNIGVPLSKTKLYDALRMVAFYDWGNVKLHNILTGEEKNKTLRSFGTGLRFSLAEDFALRLDFAWPLDNTPSDGNHLHTWVQATKNF